VTLVSIFFIVLIAVYAVVVFFTEPSKEDKLVHARLVSLDRKLAPSTDDDLNIIKEITFSRIAGLDRFLRNNRVAVGLQLLIQQSDVPWTVGRVVFGSLLMVCLGALLGNWWIAPGIFGWLPGLALGTVPCLFLLEKRRRRFRRFSELLADAIDMMSRALKAGQALPATVETVAQECEDPVASEFRRAADEQNFGLPFRESMINLSRRVPVPDLQFLVTAILVQKETGGNLAEILDKTSHVIRERVRAAGQLRVRTSQGRFAARIVIALPFAMFFLLNLLHPGYAKPLFETPTGQKMLTYAGGMMVIGIVMVQRIVRVKA